MKAEQRKELETNTLADKMGHVVQRVKSSGRRTVFIYFLIAAAIVLALGIGYRFYRQSQEAASEQWANLDDGSRARIVNLIEKEGDTYAGKAASFQYAWILYWDGGIKSMGLDPRGSLIKVNEAARIYKELAEKCKDDPIFEPQALLGMAVCEEARAVQDRAHLEKAASAYDVLAQHEKYKNTAEGKFAQARLEQLRDSKGKIRPEMGNLYDDLRRLFGVREIEAPRQQNLPFDFPAPKK